MSRRKGTARTRKGMAQSQLIYDAAVAKKTTPEIVLTGLDLPNKLTTFYPPHYGHMEVDERYQRVQIPTEFNRLIHVVKAGGQIPSPLWVGKRPDGSLWIIDGQQKYWVLAELGLPIRAFVVDTTGWEQEALLFQVFDNVVRVTADNIVKGWPGQSGKLVHALHEDNGSPMKGLITFGNESERPFTATIVAKGLLALIGGALPIGNIRRDILPRLDVHLSAKDWTPWVQAWAQLVCATFQPKVARHSRVYLLPLLALSLVARERWLDAGRPTFPRTFRRLQRTNWKDLVPSCSLRYVPVVKNEVISRWS